MKERIPFVDWLRVVACFMVMLVHAAENFYGVVTEKAIASIPDNPATPIIPVWAAIPCIAIVCYICCAVTTKIISLLPGSKWIIG
jgi:hypothetical protein